ncbi:hypothetical protein C365_03583 [Cryptococcus neoformans Bt85]|nr:hypothetical protein AYX15_03769 [Cryptococcus neoformans var. grubii]OWZ77826.1 hypothetical protein C365_03583 [Cryptococcus neoformans var. grubii Bt85]
MTRPALLHSLASVPRQAFAARAPVLVGARFINSKVGSTRGAGAVDYRVLEGIDGFLPKENFDRLKEWQLGLWERLQAEVQNNPGLVEVKQKWDRSGLDITDLLSTTAKDRSLGLAYNYGALLANNSFFLESLNAGEPIEPSKLFTPVLDKLEGYAEGIIGGGWLWIARTGDHEAQIDIIPTFGSGTLLVSGRAQRSGAIFEEPLASSPEPPVVTFDMTAPSPASATPGTAAPPSVASQGSNLKRGSSIYPAPLAVLNLFELAWLGDKYGVWAKRQYVRDWIKSVDWKKVEERNSQVTAK